MGDEMLDAARYITMVEDRTADADALDAVGAAAQVQRELGDAADQVLEHFVCAARRAGHSWTAIGDRLGVSKQAARQRFTDPSVAVVCGDLEMLPRLQACLDQARVAAEQAGVAEVDSHHLLLGLLHVGVAAVALDRLGVTRERMRDSIQRLFGPGNTAGSADERAFSVDASHAIDAAKRLARERGHPYVGTEHLLFVLGTDPGSQARRVLQDLGVSAADIKRELEDVVCPAPTRRRRRRQHPEPTCSFCRKAKPDVRMVAGPGVCICEDCLRLAGNEFSMHPAHS
ncbi:MAG: Clp protease N-terminal domain-containing protein [Haloechinothrix sp.]